MIVQFIPIQKSSVQEPPYAERLDRPVLKPGARPADRKGTNAKSILIAGSRYYINRTLTIEPCRAFIYVSNVGRPNLFTTTTTTQRRSCIEVSVSILAHVQSQKLLPGGGVWNLSSHYVNILLNKAKLRTTKLILRGPLNRGPLEIHMNPGGTTCLTLLV